MKNLSKTLTILLMALIIGSASIAQPAYAYKEGTHVDSAAGEYENEWPNFSGVSLLPGDDGKYETIMQWLNESILNPVIFLVQMLVIILLIIVPIALFDEYFIMRL